MTDGKITNTFRVGRYTCELTFTDVPTIRRMATRVAEAPFA
jgi:hypothetical protein